MDDSLSLLTELNSAQELRMKEMRIIHDDIDLQDERCDDAMLAMRHGDISISKYHIIARVMSPVCPFDFSA